MIIHDGKGTGKTAGVNKNNQLETNGIASSPEHYINHAKGQAYSVPFSATPAAPGDCFFYIKNNNDDDILVEGFGLWLVANEYIDIVVSVTGTAIGGSEITPVNLNGGSGNLADGEFQSGAAITGLSGNNAYRIYHASSQETNYTNFEMDIILPRNAALMFCIQTGTTALAGYVDMAYAI